MQTPRTDGGSDEGYLEYALRNLRHPVSAIAGGVAGMAVMSLLLLLLEVETRERIGVFEAVARFAGQPGNISLGFVLFLVAGGLAWPLLFLALEEYIPMGPDPATRGAVFAAVLWVAFVILGRGGLGGPLLVIYAAFTLLSHLAYGFVLGAVYGRLTGTTADRLGETPSVETSR
ncbi:hypothetical protein SAMN04487948_102523 [Halogranum amylolyticum]|uniref:Uncharacterized protein n=1 Tax=Halogranum amylolyticum TaxID=660520 RepID=A0A1H8PWR4_9EURY|nr:DUF6789 family protein [Halogranum amylolyticum]SEO46097.1 hypothetical protein SAMN04487948_102523 [Halogranum amylolyticum]